MTPEAQRIAIAKACGLSTDTHAVGGVFVYYDRNGHMRPSLPDYLNDLNACHEMENVLTAEQGQTWAGLLCDMTDRFDGDAWKHAAYSLAHATAAQRAEAFLKTLGKWEEKP